MCGTLLTGGDYNSSIRNIYVDSPNTLHYGETHRRREGLSIAGDIFRVSRQLLMVTKSNLNK